MHRSSSESKSHRAIVSYWLASSWTEFGWKHTRKEIQWRRIATSVLCALIYRRSGGFLFDSVRWNRRADCSIAEAEPNHPRHGGLTPFGKVSGAIDQLQLLVLIRSWWHSRNQSKSHVSSFLAYHTKRYERVRFAWTMADFYNPICKIGPAVERNSSWGNLPCDSDFPLQP